MMTFSMMVECCYAERHKIALYVVVMLSVLVHISSVFLQSVVRLALAPLNALEP